jgi:hypothetical protein
MSPEEVMDFVEACLEEAERRTMAMHAALVLRDVLPWYDFAGRRSLMHDARAHQAAAEAALHEVEMLRQAGLYDSA